MANESQDAAIAAQEKAVYDMATSIVSLTGIRSASTLAATILNLVSRIDDAHINVLSGDEERASMRVTKAAAVAAVEAMHKVLTQAQSPIVVAPANAIPRDPRHPQGTMANALFKRGQG